MTGSVVTSSDGVAAAYSRRLVDDELDELLAGLPAVAVEGPRAVGKTATALQRARTVYQLDDGAVLTSTVASYEKIRDAAESSPGRPPARAPEPARSRQAEPTAAS